MSVASKIHEFLPGLGDAAEHELPASTLSIRRFLVDDDVELDDRERGFEPRPRRKVWIGDRRQLRHRGGLRILAPFHPWIDRDGEFVAVGRRVPAGVDPARLPVAGVPALDRPYSHRVRRALRDEQNPERASVLAHEVYLDAGTVD